MAASTGKRDYKAGLKCSWPQTFDLSGSSALGRFEAEVSDVIVYGEIPTQIDGTFYRVGPDRYTAKTDAVPIDGDGQVSAFRIKDGRVDFKTRYVQTERHKLELRAKKSLFGGFKNPWDLHPCIRAAVDSTANTNVLFWAGLLLAMEEVANPYVLDPNTLETLAYDPFYNQIKSKSFTAHPKVDPFSQELVIFGYEAKGTGTDDVVTWSLGKDGRKTEECWVKQPFPSFIHDCGVTENFIVILCWTFGADLEKMKKGGHHWEYRRDRPTPFVVVPRRQNSLPAGWQPGEYRTYYWDNCVNIHTAGAWEENGKLYVECSRVHDNHFPFFPGPNGEVPATTPKADFVRWEIDPSKPTDARLVDPKVIVDLPSEFPRIDERLMTRKYNIIFLAVYIQQENESSDNIYHGLDALQMFNTATGETQTFCPGNGATVQEPTFVPRSASAPEGDGWIMAVIEPRDGRGSELVFIDTKDFTNPIAVAKLPFLVKSQIHGNWVDAKELGPAKSLVYTVEEDVKLFGKGPLEPL